MTKLDLTKPVQTRDGRPVRILCTDRKGEFPIVGLIASNYDDDIVRCWPVSGIYDLDRLRHLDLINVPPKPVKYFVNVYRNMNGITTGAPNPDKPISTTNNDFIKTIEFEVP